MFRNHDALLVSEPPAETLQACVVVPVRNEEDLLPSALRSLAEQKTSYGDVLAHNSYEVILLINNTTDKSCAVARKFQQLYPTLRLHIAERKFDKSRAHIGYVRRLLMDEACRRLESIARFDGPILSTDSDSQVAPDWIARNQEEIRAGAQAVGGRIIVLPSEQNLLNESTRQLHRYDHAYRRLVSWMESKFDPEAHDPWPRHHHHFGASLAVTANVYKAVGRLPPRRYLEDLAFYGSLIRHDVLLRHSNRVKVFTSGRIAGRTRFGLSRQLKDWQECGRRGLQMPVENRAFLEHLFSTRNRLRLLWLDSRRGRRPSPTRMREVSGAIRTNPGHLNEILLSTRRFGVLLEELHFYDACRATWPDRIRLGPLKRVAEELIQNFRSDLESKVAAPERRADNAHSDTRAPLATWEALQNGHAPHPLEVGPLVSVEANALITSERRVQTAL